MYRPPVLVTVYPENVTFDGRAGDTLLDAMLENKIPLEHECGGNCTCTTCHLHVESGLEHLSPIEEPESYRLQFAENLDSSSRLACQALIKGGHIVVARP